MFVILIAELGQLSGVAAILRFPLPQLDEDSDDSDTGDWTFAVAMQFLIFIPYCTMYTRARARQANYAHVPEPSSQGHVTAT